MYKDAIREALPMTLSSDSGNRNDFLKEVDGSDTFVVSCYVHCYCCNSYGIHNYKLLHFQQHCAEVY